MDRLTNPNGDGFIACNGCTKPMCTDCEEFKKQAAKLAQYEDTGLTPAEVAELVQAKHEFSRLQQENEQLKDLLRLAVGDIIGNCLYCKKQNDCKSRKGSHKHCWQWQHADKLKGLIEI